jgi:hypothetical protein
VHSSYKKWCQWIIQQWLTGHAARLSQRMMVT